MMRAIYKLVVLLIILPASTGIINAFAQEKVPKNDTTKVVDDSKKKKAKKEEEPEEVTDDLTTPDDNAAYENKAKYTYTIKNNTPNEQVGKVSYELTTGWGKVIYTDSLSVKLEKKKTKDYHFLLPQQKPGYYKVNFMVDVTDYTDTIRKAFGIQPEEIHSQYPRPVDFDDFWQRTKNELAKVKPDFRIVPHPEKDTTHRHVYEVFMQSWGNYTISGWLTIPIVKNKDHKFTVLLGLPGYQVDLDPIVGEDQDQAILTLNVRGQGTSRGPLDRRKDEFIFYHVNKREDYVMRGVIMDCVRALDFIYSRKDLDHDKILVSGGSMGGYLALALAGIDHRVNLCSAQNPILCDIRNLLDVRNMKGEVEFPMKNITKYVATQPGLTMKEALDNLDYYDGKNFASSIECSTIMGIGLLDPFAPPNNEYAAYNNIKAEHRIMVFKDLGHEITSKYKELEGRWMRDNFALF